MPGLNTTGVANTDDYNIGRGKVYFASIDANGNPGAYRFLGNAPEFSISLESETVEHQSSTGGLKVTDAEVVVSQKLNLSLSLDEINFENLALFASGETATYDNDNDTAIDGSSNVNLTALGRWYDLYKVASGGAPASDGHGSRLYDIGTVTIDSKQEGSDFVVDRKMGRIFFPTTSTVPLGNVDVDIAASGSDTDVDEVRALTTTSVAGALKFISENPKTADHQTEYQFHKVSLKAEGDFALIGDEFTVMQLTGAAERESTVDPDSPTLTIRTHVNANSTA